MLRYIETVTVKTVKRRTKLYLFHEKSKKQEKEASTNFFLLCQLRNMVEQFKKTPLHRPKKILQFLAPARMQKYLK